MNTITSPRPTMTILKADRLFDGTTDSLLPHPRVLLDHGTIRAIEQTDVDVSGARIVDLTGATLVPGLIDTHVHLAFDASSDPVGHLAARDDADALVSMAAAARRATRGGVTTVRDLGDRGYLSLALRAAARSDPTLPDIVAAGPPITTPGGHCHYLGSEVGTADDMRSAVLEHVEHGVDVIKIMASGGNLTPDSRPELAQFDPDLLRIAVEETHRAGLSITAHAHGTAAVAGALSAGVRPTGTRHVHDRRRRRSSPARSGGDDRRTPGEPEPDCRLRADRGYRAAQPDDRTPARPAGQPAPAVRVRGADHRRHRRRGHPRQTARRGAWAVGNLVAAGLTPAQALRACTSQAALACGLQRSKGRLAVGHDADILAIQGNPLDDPSTLHRITAVFLRGTRLEPMPC